MERYKSWINKAKSSLEIAKHEIAILYIMRIYAIRLNRQRKSH
jgi:hypothetical protein